VVKNFNKKQVNLCFYSRLSKDQVYVSAFWFLPDPFAILQCFDDDLIVKYLEFFDLSTLLA
jgi:hypothetical protein